MSNLLFMLKFWKFSQFQRPWVDPCTVLKSSLDKYFEICSRIAEINPSKPEWSGEEDSIGTSIWTPPNHGRAQTRCSKFYQCWNDELQTSKKSARCSSKVYGWIRRGGSGFCKKLIYRFNLEWKYKFYKALTFQKCIVNLFQKHT